MKAMQELSASALLLELIRIPSVSSLSNRPLMEFIKSVLEPCGWRAREFTYSDSAGVEKLNLIATPPGQSAENLSVELAFVCHTDTVPYSAAWSNAVHPEIRDGHIHGCGACDVKGFLACLLAAFATVKVGEFASTMALVFTAEEEIGCVGAARLVESGLLRARNAVIGEPTSLRPARAGKGYGLAEIRVLGKEAHSAYPAQGVSAIYRAARLIGEIEAFADALKKSADARNLGLFEPPCTTMNIGRIEGGSAKNIVAGECKFLLEWRSVPGDSFDMVPDAVRHIVAELQRDDPYFVCEMNVLRQQSGFATSEDSPLLRRWQKVTGRDAVGVSFGTEAPLLASLADDVIVAGPGDMRTAHSERECVSVEELERCVVALRELANGGVEY